MSNFQTSVDIANRALQHLGSARITAFTDDNKNASATSFAYDKLREAELRRNVWRFAVRKVALRPVASNTTALNAPAWASGTTYAQGAVVSYQSQVWESLVGSNVGSTPGTDGSNWELYAGPRTISAATSANALTLDSEYFSGELISYSGSVYRSLISQNQDIPPTANWLLIGTVANVSTTLAILYPIGAGPSSQSDTRNVYLLPGAYLREAPTDPKAGNISYLGAPSDLTADDWTFESDMLVSQSSDLIVMRFVANVTRVPKMDPMFCEGLACRIALELCEELTQSQQKMQGIGAQYKLFMSEARTVNGIEQGPVQTTEDDYIACRV